MSSPKPRPDPDPGTASIARLDAFTAVYIIAQRA